MSNSNVDTMHQKTLSAKTHRNIFLHSPVWNECFRNRKKKKIYSNKDGRGFEEFEWLYDE
jgi:hypothetical protein